MATNPWDIALQNQVNAISDPIYAGLAARQSQQALLSTGEGSNNPRAFSSGGSATPGIIPSANIPRISSSGVVTGVPGMGSGASVPGLPGGGQYDEILNIIKGILPQFSKEAAFSDSEALMERRARIEREKNMPAIQRAIEGAGTSGSSMGALLSQRAARDTAEAAAAAGAEQVRAYGGITSNLGSVLAQLASSGDPRAKLLTSLMETQMQTDASTRNARIAADASGRGNILNMPSVSYSSSNAPAAAPSSGFSGNWYNMEASSPLKSTTSRY